MGTLSTARRAQPGRCPGYRDVQGWPACAAALEAIPDHVQELLTTHDHEKSAIRAPTWSLRSACTSGTVGHVLPGDSSAQRDGQDQDDMNCEISHSDPRSAAWSTYLTRRLNTHGPGGRASDGMDELNSTHFMKAPWFHLATSFAAAQGWRWRWLRRHDLSCRTLARRLSILLSQHVTTTSAMSAVATTYNMEYSPRHAQSAHPGLTELGLACTAGSAGYAHSQAWVHRDVKPPVPRRRTTAWFPDARNTEDNTCSGRLRRRHPPAT